MTATAKTVNETLLHSAVRHQISLAQYGNKVVTDVLSLLNAADKELAAKLAVRLEAGKDNWTSLRMKQLIREISMINAENYGAAAKLLKTEMMELAGVEAGVAAKGIQSAVGAIDTSTAEAILKLDTYAMRQAIKTGTSELVQSQLIPLLEASGRSTVAIDELLAFYGKTPAIRAKATELYLKFENSESRLEYLKRWSNALSESTSLEELKLAFGKTWQGGSKGAINSDLFMKSIAESKGIASGTGLTESSAKLTKVIDALRKETADFYASQGITEIKLYRGIRGTEELASVIDSWTSSLKVAEKFATAKGTVLEKTVPVDALLFSYESHPKLLSRLAREQEYVVYNKGVPEPSIQVVGKGTQVLPTMLDDVYTNKITDTRFVFSVLQPTAEQLAAIVTTEAITLGPDGAELLDDIFKTLAAGKEARIRQAIRMGMVEGESVQDMVRRLIGTRAARFTDGIIERDRRAAEAIVRTSVNHVSNKAADMTYRQNGDLISGVQWVLTLDIRTCPVCVRNANGGKPYKMDEGPRPPVHVNDRCFMVPVLKSWEELGIDLDEMPISGRASMDGVQAGDMTYSEWLKKYPERAVEALGPARAKLFQDGKINVENFVNDKGKLLTLKDLTK